MLLSNYHPTTVFVGLSPKFIRTMSTQSADTLITLPRPLGSAEGQYQATTVWGWENGSRKRKRSEIAVGIDGEGVNIYNVCSYIYFGQVLFEVLTAVG